MSEQKTNITEYSYPTETKVEILGSVLLAILNLLNNVHANEGRMVLLADLPNENGELVEASPIEFFQQQPRRALTDLGASALDLKLFLEEVHLRNIENNIAIKNEEIGSFQI